MRKSLGTAFCFAVAATACSKAPTTPTPVDNLIDRYVLTVTAGSTCSALPEFVRRRTYAATIEPRGTNNYVVTLSDAAFLADEQIGDRSFILHCSSSYGLGCNQFTATRDGDQIRFRLASNDERFDDEFAGYGGMIVELIPPDSRRLGINGTGLGRLDGTTIQASIEGRVWYCPTTYTSFEGECSTCNQASVAMSFTRR
jgi:hypothetical protein